MMERSIVSTIILLCAFSAFAENAYTNHAGNVVSGWPVKLTSTQVALAERATPPANDYRLTTNDYQLTTNDYLPALDLPRIRAAAHRGGLRTAARAGCREARRRRCGEGDGAFAKARGEGPLHEGGERRLLREVRSRAQELPRQAGQGRRDHARRAKGHRPLNDAIARAK